MPRRAPRQPRRVPVHVPPAGPLFQVTDQLLNVGMIVWSVKILTKVHAPNDCRTGWNTYLAMR
jgi:hypothetical protein